MAAPLRIGVLGAAAIAPNAIVRPAVRSSRATVFGIAARNPERARRFAERWSIPHTYPTYDELLADPAIDAVYIPTPNGLHGCWAIAALEAGKHVLCEKPLAANADEARSVAEAAARRPNLVAMEAFHWRYHPMAQRTVDLVASGAIGEVMGAHGTFCVPNPRPGDIRWRWDLAGGALMDLGCYPLHMLRSFVEPDPVVVSASARTFDRRVDRWMRGRLDAGGVDATIECSMLSRRLLSVTFRLVGTDGSIHLRNPVLPHLGGRLVLDANGRRHVERASRRPSYDAQLDAFCAAVFDGEPTLTPVTDSVATMQVIDALYRAAGLPVREPSAAPGTKVRARTATEPL
ncbi:MAG: Gfo/Idh/MocA family oxidoreductase [Microthrixaceae bacterium]|nr:Gfo/Idh/MocA family oxidoreductase [Microthrixaceae bacterium]